MRLKKTFLGFEWKCLAINFEKTRMTNNSRWLCWGTRVLASLAFWRGWQRRSSRRSMMWRSGLNLGFIRRELRRKVTDFRYGIQLVKNRSSQSPRFSTATHMSSSSATQLHSQIPSPMWLTGYQIFNNSAKMMTLSYFWSAIKLIKR